MSKSCERCGVKHLTVNCQIVCEKCAKIFTRNSSLKRHLVICGVYKCVQCNEVFDSSIDLKNHGKTFHTNKCVHCEKVFMKPHHLKLHDATCKKQKQKLSIVKSLQKDDQAADAPGSSNDVSVQCDVCGVFYRKRYATSHFKSNVHIKSAMNSFDAEGKCSIYESALNNELRVYRIENSDSLKDVIETSALAMFEKSRECVLEVLKLELALKTSIKFRVNATANFTQQTQSQMNFNECEKSFNGAYFVLHQNDDVNEAYDKAVANVFPETMEFDKGISGWQLMSFIFLTIEIAKFDFLKGL